ncbi:DEAD/DEAH box helicase [Sporolactobacillus sp. KGMB 08714]|uniref:DEAD/DEAH box helicase n=1 Tax=Sporolactobacillus sp. KGMB 08714 TaxID=3064704 RepID=UPI002FBF1935
MIKNLTLNRLKKTKFRDLYIKLAIGGHLTRLEYKKLLELAVIFINERDLNIFKLGYRILVFYCNQTNDYKPLYDFAIYRGLYPISKFIENQEQYINRFENSFYKLFQSSFEENYRNKNIYLSEQQKNLLIFFSEKSEETISIIAPTSYGKSELIISFIEKNMSNKNICIIVPTKALIAQTKRRIMEANIHNIKKIITHPEMYQETDEKILAIFTQERLLRLLKNSKHLYFDVVFIDEAHNLLENDDRNILLATAITILEKRKTDIKFKFLTPFLIEVDNLKVRYASYSPIPFKVDEYIKTERLYVYNPKKNKRIKYYDHFLNEFFYTTDETVFENSNDVILRKSSEKNIIYLNKPSDIEHFVSSFIEKLSSVVSGEINKACEHLGDFLDPDYLLINCMKKGVIYHHGSVPENIRIYIEHIYSQVKSMKYVVTSSTLLEGVNIPAFTLFLLDNKKGKGNLSPAQFKNLIGRICRFKEIFSKSNNNLIKLEPSVYIVGSEYYSKNANIEKFVSNVMRVDKKEKEIPTNVLLENVDIIDDNNKRKKEADNFIENFEQGIINGYSGTYAETEIGRSCFLNNITEIDIIKNEKDMQRIVDLNRNVQIDNTKNIFYYFSNLFLPYLRSEDRYNNLRRLIYPEARNFYNMFLDWRIKSASYHEMISSFIGYWKKKEREEDSDIYVGRWGDKTKNGGFNKLWTDIKSKTHKERINLAIVRIKEEQDFLDNIFIKYIEVLNDLKLIKKDFYERIKYGTDDVAKITLIKNGLSITLSNILVNKYNQYLSIDTDSNSVVIQSGIIDQMRYNNENEILIYETQYNLNIRSN